MTTAAPLRACLLSGGASRRMGTDKALLAHPDGATWLEHTLRLLVEPGIPVVLFSRHPRHLELGLALSRSLAPGRAATPSPAATASAVSQSFCSTPPTEESAEGIPAPGPITPLREPAPWEGPLLALQRLMQHYPQERLLLCPVDMPLLTRDVLQALQKASANEPDAIHIAHDGQRRQPLLGIYPSHAANRQALARTLATGERRLQHWLADQAAREVGLDPRALRNVNRPEELPPLAVTSA